jgi:hypothetical protein
MGSALMNADAFYNSVPDVPTDPGETPEAGEPEASSEEPQEIEESIEAESDEVEANDENSKRYQFDDAAEEYVFKAAGKEVRANTDKLVDLAKKGVGFEKNSANLKQTEERLIQEHTQALGTVKAKESELETLIESLSELVKAETPDESLLDYDAGAYIKQKREIDSRNQKIEQAKQALSQRREAEKQAIANVEATKLKKAMGWETEQDIKEGFKPIEDYFKSAGLTNEEVSSITSHKVMLAIAEAAKYRAIKSKKDQVLKDVSKSPKSVKSKQSQIKPQHKTAIELLYGG